MNAIATVSILPFSAADVSPIVLLRRRIRQRIRARLSADPQGENHSTAEMILIYNWARGFAGTRGFSPLKRVGGNAGEHPFGALIRLVFKTDSLRAHLVSVMSDETAECQALALSHFRTWSMAIARDMLAAQFSALPAGTHGMQALLTRIAMLTPHGASNAYQHGREARVYWHALLHEFRKQIDPQALRPSLRERVSKAHIENLRMPHWAKNEAHAKRLVDAIHAIHPSMINTYLEMHDCGKAFCMTTDDQGKNHYPDHAQRSSDAWEKAGGFATECELMRKDMLVHTASASECETLASDPLSPVLLLSALAEIHANAEPIFGGFEGDSFKIKFKQLERRGAVLLKKWAS